MTDIQSKEVIDKISEELKIQPAMQIPRELAKNIQLVYNVNPEHIVQVAGANAIDETSATIINTHAVKKTFLIGFSLSVAKSVLATSLFSTISAVLRNSSSSAELIRLRYEPTTAGQHSVNYTFLIPVELSKSTAITVTNSTAIASIDTVGNIYFYEVDPQ